MTPKTAKSTKPTLVRKPATKPAPGTVPAPVHFESMTDGQLRAFDRSAGRRIKAYARSSDSALGANAIRDRAAVRAELARRNITTAPAPVVVETVEPTPAEAVDAVSAAPPIAKMTGPELADRRASANRRMQRYSKMGNEALFNIAKGELDAVEAEQARRKAVVAPTVAEARASLQLAAPVAVPTSTKGAAPKPAPKAAPVAAVTTQAPAAPKAPKAQPAGAGACAVCGYSLPGGRTACRSKSACASRVAKKAPAAPAADVDVAAVVAANNRRVAAAMAAEGVAVGDSVTADQLARIARSTRRK